MLDFMVEFVGELIGAFFSETISSRRVPKIIRTILLALLDLLVVTGCVLAAVSCAKNGRIGGLAALSAIAAVMLVIGVCGIYKIWR